MFSIDNINLDTSGLCSESKFDTHFSWTGEKISDSTNEKYMFRGYNKALIAWDSSQGLWKLTTERYRQLTILRELLKLFDV